LLLFAEFNDPFWKKEIADGKRVCVTLLNDSTFAPAHPALSTQLNHAGIFFIF